MFFSLLTLFAVQIVAVSLPGPDFLVVVRSTLKHGRMAGYLCSLGITTGVLIYCSFAVFGLSLISEDNHWVLNLVSALGACFLLYMSYKCFTSKSQITKQEMKEEERSSKKTAWLTGLATNISNPKVIVFFLSILPLFMKDYHSISYHIAVILVIIVTTALWFSMITILIGHKMIRNFFLNYSHVLEKIFGVVLILFAIGLLISIFN
ncbi:MAG: threonine efflux protein [Francisellaceae bacterium]|jgi:threonine efflux protein